MGDIKNYIIALLVIAIIRWLIPKFGRLVNWLIIKFVTLAEKTIKGSKLGEKKKKFVLKCLRLFGVKSSALISELIDTVVDTLNGKQDNIKSDITNDFSDKIDTTINNISNK
jgi:hypothetical protein